VRFERDDELLATAIEAMPEGRHCFEFRHSSWFAADVSALLEERGASLAIGDGARRPLPGASPAGRDRLPAAALRLARARRQLLQARARHLAPPDCRVALPAPGLRLPE
jgi:hypothetical protein